jgi:parallel beta-helix repeat protein
MLMRLTLNIGLACSLSTFIVGSAAAQFYVSPNGNDNNPGTLSAPFRTLARAQAAMRTVPLANRDAYLLSGTYTITSPLRLTSADDGETWSTSSRSAARSAVLLNGPSDQKIFDVGYYGINNTQSVKNITFSNLTFNGGSSGGNAIWIDGYANGVYVRNNSFLNHSNGSDLYIYNSDNIYFQDNTSGPNELEPVAGHVTDNKSHSGIFITDNKISGFNRFGVELQKNSAGYFQDVHIDRNVVNISARGNPAGNEVFSLVSGPSPLGNTVWGNTVTGVRGDNQVFLELSANNTSVEHNSVSQMDWGISFSSTLGSEVEDNTFTNVGAAFGRDGGYNDTQWVGVNEVNGVSEVGWPGVPNTTAKPKVFSASQIADRFRSVVADRVESAVVPEPSTWAMMLLGFVGLGYGSFRQSLKALQRGDAGRRRPDQDLARRARLQTE